MSYVGSKLRSRPVVIAGALAVVLALASTTSWGDGQRIPAADAADHVGETAKICGKVAGAKCATETRRQPTFLNLDRPYPNHVFTALIWGSDRSAFPYAPEDLHGKRICVKGMIELYKGRSEIIVSRPSQIEVQR